MPTVYMVCSIHYVATLGSNIEFGLEAAAWLVWFD
jgi:hypothetical protein